VFSKIRELEPSYTTNENIKRYSYFGSLPIPHKVKHRRRHDSDIPLQCIYSREMKTSIYTKICTQLFLFSQMAKQVSARECGDRCRDAGLHEHAYGQEYHPQD
jgi:hypothetical protein